MTTFTRLLVLLFKWLLLTTYFLEHTNNNSVCAFSISTTVKRPPRVVVVGKIIVDEYGAPGEVIENVSIGGGGPQAAWGAAAAMALLFTQDGDTIEHNLPPQQQPVTLVGPVGATDFTEAEQAALLATVGMALDVPPLLIPGPASTQTPRTRLWHDPETQQVQWFAINDSFGPNGADTLWGLTPTLEDITTAMGDEERVVMHCILEAGANPPGSGGDAIPFLDPFLQSRVSFLGVEPIVFAQEVSPGTWQVTQEDAVACSQQMKNIYHAGPCPIVISPDRPLHDAIQQYQLASFTTCDPFMGISPQKYPSGTDEIAPGVTMAVRDGANGSKMYTTGEDDFETQVVLVPAASLCTTDGEVVNPTGAGNAYAAAFTACMGCGTSAFDAACIATAIGAVLCEYPHIPPWNWAILERIRSGAQEVKQKRVV
eukprot:scaffold19829_cov51-Attheya_sp.AAC.5